MSARRTFAAALLAALLLALAASCGGEEEQAASSSPATQPAATATPSPAASPAASPQASTPIASSIPADWPTYSDPNGKFSLRYPVNWFARGNAFYSRNPDDFSGSTGLPPELVKVEVGAYTAVGSTACGALSVDPKTGQGTPVQGAAPVSLGGLAAWQVVRNQGNAALEGNLTQITGISLIYKSYCINLAAYFTQAQPASQIFSTIAGTFEFKF